MAKDDWYCNKEWTSEIETRFFDKLRRARDKAQYLKIQSGCLSGTYPKVALSLIEKYFALHEHFFDAEAFLHQAQAYMALGREDDAVHCLRQALQRERDFPKFVTTAWSEFAMLVATKKKKLLYEEALKALQEHKNDVFFPLGEFKWYAAQALIAAGQEQRELARDYAHKALASAEKTQSGFRYHSKVGLVEGHFEAVKKELQELLR